MVLGAFDDTSRPDSKLFGFLGREAGGPLELSTPTMGVLKSIAQ